MECKIFLEYVELEEYSIYSNYSTPASGIVGIAGITEIMVIDLDELLFRNRMISVPFEVEYMKFGILIPGIPLPEKSQKECGLIYPNVLPSVCLHH